MTPATQKLRQIALACDHAGYPLKEALKGHLRGKGIEIVDFGTNSADPVDYPNFAAQVARAISAGQLDEGILICGTGIGMAIAANKFPGVRAAVAPLPFMAKMARAHNNANVLCLGGRVLDETAAKAIVDVWLSEPFEGGRHEGRVNKIRKLDRGITPPSHL
jgi:ribose 5-phosphate isomerase B